ncbi:MAG: beta-propeller domain-containing protein [Gammaproteobacteria bacterium]|nr:beta-propeller domain-containing protein [Gammaproteobacteria bacterium]
MNNLRPLLHALLLPLMLSGCLFGSSDESQTASAASNGLSPFDSESQLLERIRSGISQSSTYQQDMVAAPEMATVASDSNTASGISSSSSSSSTGSSGGSDAGRSTTNLQIEGVDEADRFKSDSDRLYVINNTSYYGGDIGIMPVTFAASSDSSEEVIATTSATIAAPEATLYPMPQSAQNSITVYQLDSSSASYTTLANLSVGEKDDPGLSGLYLLENSRVVLIYGQRQNYWGFWHDSWAWQQGESVIEVVDLTNLNAPKVEQRLEIDGYLIASRRINNQLYIASRFSPYLPNYEPWVYADDSNSSSRNQTLLDQADSSELLPQIRVNGTAATLVTAATTYEPLLNQQSDHLSGDLVTLLQFDLQNGQWQSRTLLGNSETLFMSQNAAYFATASATYQSSDDGYLYYSPDWTTQIHKFALEESGPHYVGSGEVVGHLGWEEDKKPFRMGEIAQADGTALLGIVTSEGDEWLGDSSTRLSLLKTEASGELSLLSNLTNLGKPGEHLYAARFIEERAYLVTFRVTDPLYIIDLSSPTTLNASDHLGELEIPGYSDYLHPLPGGYLLGLGKDAVADSSSDSGDGRGAWYQGVKLTLFDVRSLKAPQALASLVIGRRGSESNALTDHHAFTWVAASATTAARLALPIAFNDYPPSYYGADLNSPSTWYDWSHTGLYKFEIDTSAATITGVGSLIAESRDSSTPYDYPDYDVSNDRALIINEALFYHHGETLLSGYWGE